MKHLSVPSIFNYPPNPPSHYDPHTKGATGTKELDKCMLIIMAWICIIGKSARMNYHTVTDPQPNYTKM